MEVSKKGLTLLIFVVIFIALGSTLVLFNKIAELDPQMSGFQTGTGTILTESSTQPISAHATGRLFAEVAPRSDT